MQSEKKELLKFYRIYGYPIYGFKAEQTLASAQKLCFASVRLPVGTSLAVTNMVSHVFETLVWPPLLSQQTHTQTWFRLKLFITKNVRRWHKIDRFQCFDHNYKQYLPFIGLLVCFVHFHIHRMQSLETNRALNNNWIVSLWLVRFHWKVKLYWGKINSWHSINNAWQLIDLLPTKRWCCVVFYTAQTILIVFVKPQQHTDFPYSREKKLNPFRNNRSLIQSIKP